VAAVKLLEDDKEVHAQIENRPRRRAYAPKADNIRNTLSRSTTADPEMVITEMRTFVAGLLKETYKKAPLDG